ncbi:MAG: Gfo/Idh/MocA family oxidoreductase [Armatimonadetes bacterium]|nr:Gfo/Idh/MocA family oxidoreductase [Armatimonadota bacterium]
MARYRVAVIGLGRMASTIDDECPEGKQPSVLLPYSHIAAYRAVPEVEVVAGSDVVPEKRSAFTERWGVAATYADYREMLAKEQPDIVSVCTHTVERCEVVCACAATSVKAIYAEKPIATSLAEADQMVDACAARGIPLAIGCSRRWHPWHVRARELAEQGVIGDLLQVTGLLHCHLSHNGSHLIDIVRYHAGNADVQWVYGEMMSDEAAATDDDQPGNGYLHFANGVTGIVRGMPSGPVGVEIDVLGSAGRIRGVGNGLDWEVYKPGDDRLSGMARYPFPRTQHILAPNVHAAYDILRCIEHGGDPACSGKDGRAALEVAIAIRESHRRRARIDLPLPDRSLKIVALA